MSEPRETILVVDDDHAMRLTIGAILEDDGYRIVLAGDGVEALEKLAEVQPALIVLDVGLPRMNGYTLAEELARRGLRPRIPVLVITADGRAEQKAARLGAEAGLAKPFALAELLECVGRLLQRGSP